MDTKDLIINLYKDFNPDIKDYQDICQKIRSINDMDENNLEKYFYTLWRKTKNGIASVGGTSMPKDITDEDLIKFTKSIININNINNDNYNDVFNKINNSITNRNFNGKTQFINRVFVAAFPDLLCTTLKEEYLDFVAKNIPFINSDVLDKSWYEKNNIIRNTIANVLHEENIINNERYKLNLFIWKLYEFFSENPEIPSDADKIDLPPIENVKYEFVDLKILSNEKSKKPSINNKNFKNKDYQSSFIRNNRNGLRGEEIVVIAEKSSLIEMNKEELAKKVDHTALTDDSKGYDILSYDENENEIHIEVKSTRKELGDAYFIITGNEFAKAESDDKFRIYVVFKVDTIKPKIWKLGNPFINSNKSINIEPIRYKVHIKTKIR